MKVALSQNVSHLVFDAFIADHKAILLGVVDVRVLFRDVPIFGERLFFIEFIIGGWVGNVRLWGCDYLRFYQARKCID